MLLSYYTGRKLRVKSFAGVTKLVNLASVQSANICRCGSQAARAQDPAGPHGDGRERGTGLAVQEAGAGQQSRSVREGEGYAKTGGRTTEAQPWAQFLLPHSGSPKFWRASSPGLSPEFPIELGAPHPEMCICISSAPLTSREPPSSFPPAPAPRPQKEPSWFPAP